MPAEIVDADSHVYEPPAVWDFVPDGERPSIKDLSIHK